MNYTETSITSPNVSKLREGVYRLFNPSESEDKVIDGLRGLSILMIILFHSFYGVMVLLKKPEPILMFIRKLPTWTAPLLASDKAVDIFFVVSAYLVSGSIFRALAQGRTVSIKNFYGKRIARIYPLFLVALLLYAPINVSRSLKYLAYNLLFIDNYPFRSIIPVGWSLSIEMQFYLVLPWVALLLFKLTRKWQIISLWGLFSVSLIIPILVCLRFPEAYQTPFYQFHPDMVDPTVMMDELYYPTHTRFGPLVLGLILALHELTPSQVSKYRCLIGIFVMGVFMQYPVYNPDHWFYHPFTPSLNLFLQSWHRSGFCVGLYLLMSGLKFGPRTQVSQLVSKVLSWKIWRPYSQAVFPIYLFHFPMIGLAGLTVFQTTKIASITTVSLSQVLSIFLLASVYSLIIGGLLHIYVEQPILNKAVRWLYKSKTL